MKYMKTIFKDSPANLYPMLDGAQFVTPMIIRSGIPTTKMM
jgi:hypothetical protein